MRTERISLADIASRFAELRQLWRTSSRRGNLTSDEEYQIIGTDDPEKGPCIQYQKEIVFKHIVISATRPLAKVMGFHPATTLHIFLGSSATRAEARSDFLEYLHERGLPEDFTKRCGLLFDNAVAVDEDGNFCD